LYFQIAKDEEYRKLSLFPKAHTIVCTWVCCLHFISAAMWGVINDSLIVITMLLPVVILYLRGCFVRKISSVLHKD